MLVTLGWTDDEIASEVERREAAHSERARSAHDWDACRRWFRCEHCNTLWPWRERRSYIGNAVALARYRVSGELPPAWMFAARSAIAENPEITGPAVISHTDLEAFLAVWVQAAVGSCTGRTANSDRALILAFASIAWRAGTLIVAPGDRRLGEAADLSHPTTWKARQRLEGAGLLRKVTEASAFQASAFVLTCPSLILNPLVHTGKPLCLGDLINKWVSDETSHPAFHHLGKSQRFMLAALQDAGRPLGAEAWLRASGVRRATFYRNLEKLKACEVPLVVETGSGYLPHPEQLHHLDLIAENTGATKAVERRKELHDVERQGRRRFYTWRTVKLALRQDDDAVVDFVQRFEILADQQVIDKASGEIVSVAEALEAFGVGGAQAALALVRAPEPIRTPPGPHRAVQRPLMGDLRHGLASVDASPASTARSAA